MEFVVAQIERGVDGTEGLERVGHLLFLAIVVDAGTAVHYQTVRRHASETRRLVLYNTETNSFSFCWVEVMALRTERRFTRDLIFEAVPYSVLSMFTELAIYTRQKYKETMYLISRTNNQRNHRSAVSKIFTEDKSTYPFAFSKVLISFLILHISTFLSSCVILLKSYSLRPARRTILQACFSSPWFGKILWEPLKYM